MHDRIGTINSKKDLEAVSKVNAYVKILNPINWCGKFVAAAGYAARIEAMKRTRRDHGAAFKTQVAFAAVKGEKTLPTLPVRLMRNSNKQRRKGLPACPRDHPPVFGFLEAAHSFGSGASGQEGPRSPLMKPVVDSRERLG